jgi:DNA-binding MarR family transcriptional regulator
VGVGHEGGRYGERGLLVTLQHEIGKALPFDSPEQEAYLNIVRTASILGEGFARLFAAHGLSESAYNALRILRGAGERGRMCQEIGGQLVSRVPDVTRLVDRLERDGFVERRRGERDRRAVYVVITGRGLGVLAALDEPVRNLHGLQLGHIGAQDLARLIALLEQARAGCSGEGERTGGGPGA